MTSGKRTFSPQTPTFLALSTQIVLLVFYMLTFAAKGAETSWIVWNGAPSSYPKSANGVGYAERATGYLILPATMGGKQIDVTYTGEVAAFSQRRAVIRRKGEAIFGKTRITRVRRLNS